MALEIAIDQRKSEVSVAILQFAARRGYTLSQPWYLEGPRIEAAPLDPTYADRRSIASVGTRGWRWKQALRRTFDMDAPPRVDLTLKRKQGKTLVTMTLSSNRHSVDLAYALRAYLADDRSYNQSVPAVCTGCGASVTNPMAHYCRRCGRLLVESDGGATDGRLLAQGSPAFEHAIAERSGRPRAEPVDEAKADASAEEAASDREPPVARESSEAPSRAQHEEHASLRSDAQTASTEHGHPNRDDDADSDATGDDSANEQADTEAGAVPQQPSADDQRTDPTPSRPEEPEPAAEAEEGNRDVEPRAQRGHIRRALAEE